jgi:predicted transposase YdaD
MPHDQLFKELLRAFLREFMQLFFPEVAARLDWEQVTFPNVELFTDVPEGSVRRADMVALVPTLDNQPELVLIHVETQSVRRNEVRFRMFEYYMLLRLRYKLPVFPIVLYIAPGTGGSTHETYTENLFGKDILTFAYAAIGLPELQADDYLQSDNPLAPALSALMQASGEGRARQKQVSLQRVAVSSVDEARKFLLTNLIETYLPLDAAEQEQFEQLLATPEAMEARQMISIYETRGREEGILIGKRETVLTLLRLKFGAVPPHLETQVRELPTQAELDALFAHVVAATSLQEVEGEAD